MLSYNIVSTTNCESFHVFYLLDYKLPSYPDYSVYIRFIYYDNTLIILTLCFLLCFHNLCAFEILLRYANAPTKIYILWFFFCFLAHVNLSSIVVESWFQFSGGGVLCGVRAWYGVSVYVSV